MKNYIVKLKLTGAMTQVPDSQKLFGALMYLFAETAGAQQATRLAKAIMTKEIHLALSSVLPEGYLPTPQEYLVQCISEIEGKDADLKKIRTAIKEKAYIQHKALEAVLKGPKKCTNLFPYVKQQDFQQLRASIDSTRYQIPELDTRLYSVPTVVLSEINRSEKAGERSQPIHWYCFYLQVGDSQLCSDFVRMLETAVDDREILILGKRASQGLNLFQLTSITKLDKPTTKSDWYLNTGMLLPDSIDFKSSCIRLFTSERRPFEMAGGWQADSLKQYVSFIAQGSMVTLCNGLQGAGRSIESPFRKGRDIVFGNAFLYPISLNERQV